MGKIGCLEMTSLLEMRTCIWFLQSVKGQANRCQQQQQQPILEGVFNFSVSKQLAVIHAKSHYVTVVESLSLL